MVVSPLRYPGGKARLFPFFARVLSTNQLFERDYCEPYAGGAGLALRLLVDGYVKSVRLNDIDPAIYAFWRAVLDHNEAFCALIERTELSIAEWHHQKELWRSCDRDDHLTLGFATFFLNRTNRSGIIYGGGPIGGFQQTGAWKLDVRLVKHNQIANLKRLNRYRGSINVSNLDAIDFVSACFEREDALLYLDPPYYVKGRKLYTNSYQDADHVKIRELLDIHPERDWIVSYDDCPRIREIYSSYEPVTYSLNYSAGSKSVGREVIFASPTIEIPDVEGFQVAA
jgi:DNA adenine methylase